MICSICGDKDYYCVDCMKATCASRDAFERKLKIAREALERLSKLSICESDNDGPCTCRLYDIVKAALKEIGE